MEAMGGVNIELGDDVSRMMYEAARASWQNRPGAVVDMHHSFSGARAIRPNYKPDDCFEGFGSDGIGTKVEIAERTMDHSRVAFDLFAMACDDAVVRGAEPIAISTVLDVNELRDEDPDTRTALRQLAQGYLRAAKAAGVVILNGEVAELGDRIGGYGPFNYNWSATVLWYAQRDRLLTGRAIMPGQALIGLPERGFRSNGITDVRRVLGRHYGPQWHDQRIAGLSSLTLGQAAQLPSTIYTKFVTELTGGFDRRRRPKAKITGVAHITGGGQPSKLGRMLEPSGYGALIDDPLSPPLMMRAVQRLGGYSDREAYGKWHMGPGMILATMEPTRVLEHAHSWGLQAKLIGHVTEEPGIRIKNCGVQEEAEWLEF
jgi:phosphoribosylformylglycinamidine cyclo-ligase